MLRHDRTLGLALLLAAGITLSAHVAPAQSAQPVLAKPASTPSTPARNAKAHSRKPAPVPEVAQVPAPPPTLEQQPPVPPQVSYRNGQLSIDARNATLSQVLHSVQAQTGASMDIPPGAGGERVVATLGPGKPKDVLASLLNGSRFDYVLLGETNNPGAVQKVILLTRASSASMPQSQNNARPIQPQQSIEPPEEDYQQNEPEADSQTPPAPGSDQSTPDAINAQPAAGRTPEQMLQELQRLQQQQQQMQQQLNPANQPNQPLTPGQPLAIRPNN